MCRRATKTVLIPIASTPERRKDAYVFESQSKAVYQGLVQAKVSLSDPTYQQPSELIHE